MILLSVYVFIAFVMAFLWNRQRQTLIANSVDVAWSGSFAVYALAIGIVLSLNNLLMLRSFLILLFIFYWSFRLAFYLYRDRCAGKNIEDKRYALLRKTWNQKKFFIFYQFQALSTLSFAFCFYLSVNSSMQIRWVDALGLLVFFTAIMGESIADAQLSAHRKDSTLKGKTCRRGLWKYSRHPNYFFEWLHWWAYVFFAWGHPLWFLSFVGPLVMFYLFFNVTGIPPTEEQALKSRVDYKEYQSTTSVFIPWWPKSKKSL